MGRAGIRESRVFEQQKTRNESLLNGESQGHGEKSEVGMDKQVVELDSRDTGGRSLLVGVKTLVYMMLIESARNSKEAGKIEMSGQQFGDATDGKEDGALQEFPLTGSTEVVQRQINVSEVLTAFQKHGANIPSNQKV